MALFLNGISIGCGGMFIRTCCSSRLVVRNFSRSISNKFQKKVKTNFLLNREFSSLVNGSNLVGNLQKSRLTQIPFGSGLLQMDGIVPRYQTNRYASVDGFSGSDDHELNKLILETYLDKSYTEEDFLKGAKLAISHVLNHAYKQDYEAIQPIASAEVAERLEELISPIPADERKLFDLSLNDFSHETLKFDKLQITTEFVTLNMNVNIWATKRIKGIATKLDFGCRFSYEVTADKGSIVPWMDDNSFWKITKITSFGIIKCFRDYCPCVDSK